MAWRLEEAVAHGEIDNTVEGHTTGRIWLVGRDEPLILSLDGDCWRDLAGTRLQFENPSPFATEDAAALDIDQSGIAGDMTASRRNRVPTVSEAVFHELYQSHLEIPYEWRNTLYLEWFSEINGRVVIESAAYILTISPHEWQMDEDAEDAQKLANLNSMRDFMAQVIRRRDPAAPELDAFTELDESAWEERLKESDRLTDAYQEVLEKYMEDVDSEQKEAFVMGWDGLLDALADRDEAEEDDEEDELFYGEDFQPADDEPYRPEDYHPLQVKAQKLAIWAMEEIHRDEAPESISNQLVTNLLQVSGRLAGVLHQPGSSHAPENGLVLAVLKRCLNWLNEGVGSCQELLALEQDPDHCAKLNELRKSIFEIRDGIVQLRREMK
jgi:hypothetical protein